MKTLRPYMVYANIPDEGAVLVFHYTAREAKLLGSCYVFDHFTCEYIDIRVKWLKNRPWIDILKDKNEPHVIENPPVCKGCELWGLEPSSENPEYCVNCWSEVDNEQN